MPVTWGARRGERRDAGRSRCAENLQTRQGAVPNILVRDKNGGQHSRTSDTGSSVSIAYCFPHGWLARLSVQNESPRVGWEYPSGDWQSKVVHTPLSHEFMTYC